MVILFAIMQTISCKQRRVAKSWAFNVSCASDCVEGCELRPMRAGVLLIGQPYRSNDRLTSIDLLYKGDSNSYDTTALRNAKEELYKMRPITWNVIRQEALRKDEETYIRLMFQQDEYSIDIALCKFTVYGYRISCGTTSSTNRYLSRSFDADAYRLAEHYWKQEHPGVIPSTEEWRHYIKDMIGMAWVIVRQEEINKRLCNWLTKFPEDRKAMISYERQAELNVGSIETLINRSNDNVLELPVKEELAPELYINV